ncbi:sulfurtransferase TusA family protein [Acinetobacter apis]|uniref:tRNA 2-thiouridine synthesizing protein A n=1 Tax=Acinetobacter apis TaxID=1229165 RepID=A0A217EET0_9GAMM|nr:sulfurtransferase TusA family protein [Acinetobacter apis]SNQ28720.1 tRNA 2-thiouridine synthesizing protein A [Acinetobacter apis]
MDSSQLKIVTIDAIGQPCPMPLLMLKRALKANSITETKFHLISSDENSEVDILRYCQLHHLQCRFQMISDHEFHYEIAQNMQD